MRVRLRTFISAYQRILSACESFENPPRFFSSESSDFGGLEIPGEVSGWMNTAAQVSIGGRRQVMEDGNEVCNSETPSENEEGYQGDKLWKG
jgi:hypothetical protein